MDYEKLEKLQALCCKEDADRRTAQKIHKVRSIGQRKPDNEIRKAIDF